MQSIHLSDFVGEKQKHLFFFLPCPHFVTVREKLCSNLVASKRYPF